MNISKNNYIPKITPYMVSKQPQQTADVINRIVKKANETITKDERVKLQTIEPGATKVTVDKALSPTSKNPVENSAVYSEIKRVEDAELKLILSPNDIGEGFPLDANTLYGVYEAD